MKILITGGAGFIGSHLAGQILRAGHEVEIVDNLSDFYPREKKIDNLREVRKQGAVRFHESDICEEDKMDAIVRRFQPDAVIHLAAEAGLRRSLEQPLRYEHVNVYGTLSLLESCRKFDVRRFIFASSSSVYGSTTNIPFREDDEALYPLSPYAASKLSAEKMCYVYARLYEMQITCLRLFTVYGPRQRPDLAIRKFIEQIDLGNPIVMFGDGTSGRDYTYVGDIVDGFIKTLDYQGQFDVINLGNSHPVSLNQMIAAVESALGKKAIVQPKPWNLSEAPITFASIEKAHRLLGYEPKMDFADGIRQTVDWFHAAAPTPEAVAAIR